MDRSRTLLSCISFSIPVFLAFYTSLYNFNYWTPFYLEPIYISIFSLMGFLLISRKVKIDLTLVLICIFFLFQIISGASRTIPEPLISTYLLFSLCLIYLLGHIVAQHITDWIFIVICYLGAAEGGISILQYISKSTMFFPGHTGTFMNPCFLGFCGGLGLVSTTILLLKDNKETYKIFLILCLMLNGIGLCISQSRIAMLGATFSLLCLLYFYYRCKKRLPKIYIAALILFLTVSLLIVWHKTTLSVDGRLLIWKIGFNIFRENWLFGIGLGNFAVKYGEYQASFFMSGQATANDYNLAALTNLAFCEPFKLLIESGIFIFAIGLIIILKCLHLSFKSTGKDQNKSVFCLLICFLVYLLFSYPFENKGLQGLFVLLLAQVNTHDSKLPIIRVPRFFFIPLLISIVSTGYRSCLIHQWKRCSTTNNLSSYSRLYRSLDECPEFLYNYAFMLRNEGDYEKSLMIGTRAQKYLTSIPLLYLIGDNLVSLKRYHKAEEIFRQCHFSCPALFSPYERLLDLYILTEQNKKALIYCQLILNKEEKIPSHRIVKIKNYAAFIMNNLIKKYND